jgi:hypothetical protein
MSASPICPRCGEPLVVRPGSTAQAWCHTHGAISPLHYTTLLAHDAITAVTTDANVPAWVPDPMPNGWSVTGLACAGPAPLGGPAEIVLVAEEPGMGVGCGYAGLPGPDPGDVISGPSSADVKAAGQRAPLWAVPTDDGRAAFVGEAYGVWLWLVMWRASTAWLLAEQVELLDLRDRLYPDLPLGPPSEHLLPGR